MKNHILMAISAVMCGLLFIGICLVDSNPMLKLAMIILPCIWFPLFFLANRSLFYFSHQSGKWMEAGEHSVREEQEECHGNDHS